MGTLIAMAHRYDLVVFDLDGTLADTKQDLADATNHTMRALGLPEHPPEIVAGFVGGGLRLLLQRALGPKGGDPATMDRAYAAFVPWYREHMLDATRPYAGARETVDAILAAGVRAAIATNKPRTFTAGIVEALFPRRFAPVVSCGDDAPRKPDPTCVKLAWAAHAGVTPARTLFVGDSAVDVETARAAGVDVASCAYGFGARAELAALSPRWLVDDVRALGPIILGETA